MPERDIHLTRGEAVCGLRDFSSCHAEREREEGIAIGPTLGDRVSIEAGEKMVGFVRIDDDVSMGTNAVVTKDISYGATVVGFSKVIKEESNGRGASE